MAKFTAHDIRRLAVAAHCDPRTVAKVLRGEHVAQMTAERIAAALVAEGHRAPSADTSTGHAA